MSNLPATSLSKCAQGRGRVAPTVDAVNNGLLDSRPEELPSERETGAVSAGHGSTHRH